MDDQVVGDDAYSDNDLDALPDNDFGQLEENAIRFSQQPARPKVAPRLPPFKSPHRPIRHPLTGAHGSLSVPPAAVLGRQQNGLHELSSDYGDFDDEMLDGEIFDAAEEPSRAAAIQSNEYYGNVSESTQSEQWRQQRYGQPSQGAVFQPSRPLHNPRYGAFSNQHQTTVKSLTLENWQQQQGGQAVSASTSGAQNDSDPSELHAQIELVR